MSSPYDVRLLQQAHDLTVPQNEPAPRTDREAGHQQTKEDPMTALKTLGTYARYLATSLAALAFGINNN
jgi:hypothetical protein